MGTLHIFHKNPKNMRFHYGILVKKPANELHIQDGQPVVTIEGDAGQVVKFYGSVWKPNKEKWLDVKLQNKSYKHVHVSNVFRLFVFIPLVGNIPLSHACYSFVTPKDINHLMRFRITNRNYAMLEENFMKEREYIAKLRKSRYGASFLDRLNQLNYTIKKNKISWIKKLLNLQTRVTY